MGFSDIHALELLARKRPLAWGSCGQFDINDACIAPLAAREA
jgi:hypothetical protein